MRNHEITKIRQAEILDNLLKKKISKFFNVK